MEERKFGTSKDFAEFAVASREEAKIDKITSLSIKFNYFKIDDLKDLASFKNLSQLSFEANVTPAAAESFVKVFIYSFTFFFCFFVDLFWD